MSWTYFLILVSKTHTNTLSPVSTLFLINCHYSDHFMYNGFYCLFYKSLLTPSDFCRTLDVMFMCHDIMFEMLMKIKEEINIVNWIMLTQYKIQNDIVILIVILQICSVITIYGLVYLTLVSFQVNKRS